MLNLTVKASEKGVSIWGIYDHLSVNNYLRSAFRVLEYIAHSDGSIE